MSQTRRLADLVGSSQRLNRSGYYRSRSVPRATVPDREDLDIASTPPIRDNVIADNQPARAGQRAWCAGIGKLGKLKFGALQGLRKTLGRHFTVLREKGRDL